MARLTKEMYYLAQDIFCRYVVQEKLTLKNDIQQVAQTCIALTSEFFAAFEATQDALSKAERNALAKDLPKAQALVVESSEVAKALKGERQEAPRDDDDNYEGQEGEELSEANDGPTDFVEPAKVQAPQALPKAWKGKTPGKMSAPVSKAPGEAQAKPGAPSALPATPARKIARRKKK